MSNTTIVWNVSKMNYVHLQDVEKKGRAGPLFAPQGRVSCFFLVEEAWWSYGSESSPAVFAYSMWPSPEARFAHRVASFLGQESYFWLTWVGSDVTSVSSSSGLRSSLAPEILLSFPVVLVEVEEVWSQQRQRDGQAGRRLWRSLSHPSPLIQWCFSRWQMLLNPPWPRELWWLSWVTGP